MIQRQGQNQERKNTSHKSIVISSKGKINSKDIGKTLEADRKTQGHKYTMEHDELSTNKGST